MMQLNRVFCQYCKTELTDKEEIENQFHIECKNEMDSFVYVVTMTYPREFLTDEERADFKPHREHWINVYRGLYGSEVDSEAAKAFVQKYFPEKYHNNITVCSHKEAKKIISRGAYYMHFNRFGANDFALIAKLDFIYKHKLVQADMTPFINYKNNFLQAKVFKIYFNDNSVVISSYPTTRG